MGLLASTYRDMGEHDRALPLLESGLAALKAGFGRDHPKTLTSMNILASAYRAAGRTAEAIPQDIRDEPRPPAWAHP